MLYLCRRALRASTKVTQEMWKSSRRELKEIKRILHSMHVFDQDSTPDLEGECFLIRAKIGKYSLSLRNEE